MKKICVITGTRAEYGLLHNLIKEIYLDNDLELQIIVTGMHLSSEFGLTYKDIEKEFNNIEKLEILLSSDSTIGLCKTMGLAQISIAEIYNRIKPNMIVVLGDRYEIFSCVASAMICNIPVAHLHGGEATEGLIDEAIRHSITKMSHLHFVATEEYRKRVIQLGEHPNRVYNVGGFGVDNIKSLKLLDRIALENKFDIKFRHYNFLITFHPVTLENNSAEEQFKNLLDALDEFVNMHNNVTMIFTKANSDTNGRIINQMIDEYVSKNNFAIGFTSMGSLGYLSTMANVDAVVGNSSSGLGEAPSFKVATINIGDRQKGRIKAKSVIDVEPIAHLICLALQKAISNEFKNVLKNVSNPYGNGGSAHKTKELIKENLNKYTKEALLKKRFYDIGS